MSSTVYFIDCGEVKEQKMPSYWFKTRKEAEDALTEQKKKRIAELRKELAKLEAEIDD